MANSFAEWLALNPAPDLQELVARHGSYSAIPPDVWAEWDLACTQWDADRRDHLLGSRTWEVAKEVKKGVKTSQKRVKTP